MQRVYNNIELAACEGVFIKILIKSDFQFSVDIYV